MKIIEMLRKSVYGEPLPNFEQRIDLFCVIETKEESDAFNKANVSESDWATEFGAFEEKYVKPLGVADWDIFYYLDATKEKMPEIDEQFELDDIVWERVR